MKVTSALGTVADPGPSHVDVMAALRRMFLLDTIVLVTIYRPHRGDGPRVVYSPDLSILPTASTTGRPTSRWTTLRLAYYGASPRTPPCVPVHHDLEDIANEHETNRVSFKCMLEQLTSRMYDGRLEHLVVQLSPRFEIDDAETALGQLRRHFYTVCVEQIEKMPQMPMPLPPCCIEPDEGSGGSYPWTDHF